MMRRSNTPALRFVTARRDRNCVVIYCAPNRKITLLIADPKFASAALRVANRPIRRIK